MPQLNYQHLLYFWTVAREGTITAACEKLHLTQPTISTQLRALETSLGHPLFDRRGRSLSLTDTGRVVYRYANEIFGLGQDLLDQLEGRPVTGRWTLRIGLADAISKQVAHLLLRPVIEGPEPIRITCYEGKPSALFASLAVNDLDLVLSDSPVPPEVRLRGFNHLLGESDVTVVAAGDLAARYRRRFPKSLDGAPFLLPTPNTSLRRSLDHWFTLRGVRPSIVAEFEDTALLGVFGAAGEGLFVIPAILEEEFRRSSDIRPIGRIESVRTQYFAVSLEQRLQHPGVIAVVDTAHEALSQ